MKYFFLNFLLQKKEKIFSSDEIALYLWDDIIDFENSSKLKDIIKRLRKKLPKDYKLKIFTVQGIKFYRLILI